MSCCRGHELQERTMESQDQASAQRSFEDGHGDDHDEIDYTRAVRREFERYRASADYRSAFTESELTGELHNGYKVSEAQTDLGDTGNSQVWFDVLPSFEMHNSMRDTAPLPELSVPPPLYNEDHCCHSQSQQETSPSRETDINSVPDYFDFSSINPATSTNTTFSSENTSSHDEYNPQPLSQRNIVDNIHKLPYSHNPLVDVQVHVTKYMPKMDEKAEKESMLKEYTSGDFVHGYVVIENKSSVPVKFNAFYVSLQGNITVIDKNSKKAYSKKFLNMVDLSASWSYGCIASSSNRSCHFGCFDWDNCHIGLTDNRTLKPNIKYKKFFVFKFPYACLDDTCRHQQPLHTLLPPSFGLNSTKKKNENIRINPSLNYGHLGYRGSPVLTNDLSSDSLSVNYSINASLIGMNAKDGSEQLTVIRSCDYALRFIPFGFGVSLFSSKKVLNSLKAVVENAFFNAERGYNLNAAGNEEEVRSLDQSIKAQQLVVRSNLDGANDLYANPCFPMRNETTPTDPEFRKIESTLKYFHQPKKSLLSKFTNNDRAPDLSQSGLITIRSKPPKDGLPYISPGMIRKTNTIKKLDSVGLANHDILSSSLDAHEKKILTNLTFDINFSPSDYNSGSNPPEIRSIVSKLVVMNVSSSSAIPIKLSLDIYLDTNRTIDADFHKMKDDFAKFNDRLERLETKFKSKGLDLQKYVHGSIVADIKSMKDMNMTTYSLECFKTKVNKSSDDYNNEWMKHKAADGKVDWLRKMKLDLEFHDDIKETLVPNFQSCLISRLYCIEVIFTFDNGKSCCVRIPVRFRNFNDGFTD